MTVTLFRPVGQKELDLIAESGWIAFPPRLDWQPIFYPMFYKEYAIQIARDWNAKSSDSGGVGYVTRFAVRAVFIAKYKPEVVGSAVHRELWIPAEDLDEFNRNIVGKIEVIHEFRSP